MIYKSNLTAPDLRPFFKHLHVREMPHSMGHDVPSDWADKTDNDPVFGLYKKCGMLTHDEGAIVYRIVCEVRGVWIDIGAHTGWSTWHIRAATSSVYPIDPMLAIEEFKLRFAMNHDVDVNWTDRNGFGGTSADYFKEKAHSNFLAHGYLIDGDHSEGKPLEDAINAAKHLADTGAIIFHDGTGKPVREAVQYLMAQGFHCRPYWTPHMLFLCWRGDFMPPDHVPDPNVKAQLLDGRLSDFDFTRCQ